MVIHCCFSRILAYEDQKVKADDTVGIIGNIGRSTEKHLHIFIRLKRKYINPQAFFDNINSNRLEYNVLNVKTKL